MSYTEITRDEMDAVLLSQGFKRGTVAGTLEWIYAKGIQIKVSGKPTDYALTIYSSVDVRTNRSRSVGQDAIRVCITKMRGKYLDVMAGDKRVNRVENWRVNLQERINRITDNFVACPVCGAPMIQRRYKVQGKDRTFLGCSTYHETKCRGTREG